MPSLADPGLQQNDSLSSHKHELMQKVLLDSSVWLSYILQDRNFEKAVKILDSLSEFQIILPEIILIEIINVLSKSVPIERIKEKIEMIVKKNNVIISHIHGVWQLALHVKTPNIKSMDYLIILFVFALQIEKFYTFDNSQNNAYEETKKISKENIIK